MSSTTRTLIHLHTDYSFDSNISLDDLSRFCEVNGFRCVAVTDHDTLDGALRLRDRGQLQVVVGEEITTRDGHLIGLFIERHVPSGLNARETALAIQEQGGLVLLPHAFVRAFGCGVRTKASELVDVIDAVEINNAQNLWAGPDRKAAAFARVHRLPGFVGADSHSKESIAPCYQVMRPFFGPSDFLTSLVTAELHLGRHPMSYFARTLTRIARHAVGFPLPQGFGAKAERPKTESGSRLAPSSVHDSPAGRWDGLPLVG